MPREHFTWQVMVFPGTISVASFVLTLPLPLHRKETRILLVAGRLASFQVTAGLHILAWVAHCRVWFLRPVWEG